jgi:hypothetical protein
MVGVRLFLNAMFTALQVLNNNLYHKNCGCFYKRIFKAQSCFSITER